MSEVKIEYKIGDIVKLKSHSPNMTVVGINEKDGNYIEVSWYHTPSNEFKGISFHRDALKLVKE